MHSNLCPDQKQKIQSILDAGLYKNLYPLNYDRDKTRVKSEFIQQAFILECGYRGFFNGLNHRCFRSNNWNDQSRYGDSPISSRRIANVASSLADNRIPVRGYMLVWVNKPSRMRVYRWRKRKP